MAGRSDPRGRTPNRQCLRVVAQRKHRVLPVRRSRQDLVGAGLNQGTGGVERQAGARGQRQQQPGCMPPGTAPAGAISGSRDHATVVRTWGQRKVTESDRYYFAYDGGVTAAGGTVAFSQSSLDLLGTGGGSQRVRGCLQRAVASQGRWGTRGRNVVVDSVRIGVPCIAVGCTSDYYNGSQLDRGRHRRLHDVRLRRRCPAGQVPAGLDADLDGTVELTWSDRG